MSISHQLDGTTYAKSSTSTPSPSPPTSLPLPQPSQSSPPSSSTSSSSSPPARPIPHRRKSISACFATLCCLSKPVVEETATKEGAETEKKAVQLRVVSPHETSYEPTTSMQVGRTLSTGSDPEVPVAAERIQPLSLFTVVATSAARRQSQSQGRSQSQAPQLLRAGTLQIIPLEVQHTGAGVDDSRTQSTSESAIKCLLVSNSEGQSGQNAMLSVLHTSSTPGEEGVGAVVPITVPMMIVPGRPASLGSFIVPMSPVAASMSVISAVSSSPGREDALTSHPVRNREERESGSSEGMFETPMERVEYER